MLDENQTHFQYVHALALMSLENPSAKFSTHQYPRNQDILSTSWQPLNQGMG
jgi:hypothetical protein